MEYIGVLILVVVAIIQVWLLKVEVEKGSVWTVIVRRLIGPKLNVNTE